MEVILICNLALHSLVICEILSCFLLILIFVYDCFPTQSPAQGRVSQEEDEALLSSTDLNNSLEPSLLDLDIPSPSGNHSNNTQPVGNRTNSELDDFFNMGPNESRFVVAMYIGRCLEFGVDFMIRMLELDFARTGTRRFVNYCFN